MSQKPFNPSWLDDAGLSQAEFRVYLHLCRRANSQTGIAWPSVDGIDPETNKPSKKSIVAVCSMSRRTAWKVIGSLIDKKLIEKIGRQQFGSSNRYRILTPIDANEAPIDEPPIDANEAPPIDANEAPPIDANEAPPIDANEAPGRFSKEGYPTKGIHRRKSIKEISLEGNQFAQWFKGSLPETTKLQTGWRQSFAQTYDDLIRLDKRNPDEIRRVCQWARTDSFWASNFQSPAKLRTRNKDGILGYDVLLQKMIQSLESRKPASSHVNTHGRKNTNSEDL